MAGAVHFEVHTGDLAGAGRFYAAMFGWQTAEWSPEYWMISAPPEERVIGGLTLRRGPPPVDGQPVNAWVVTVDVDDVTAAVERAVALGGRVALAKMPVPGVGWVAYVKDLDGNIFGMLEADPSAA